MLEHGRDRSFGLDRRHFLGAALSLLAWPLARYGHAADATAGRASSLSAETLSALASSPLVYVCPLKSDGSESSCHGEVWFGWIDGSVIVNTSAETWKSRSLAKNLDRARVWVGDYGRWKGTLTRNESFRAAPHFDAHVARETDTAVLDGLLVIYGKKYPAEIDRWRDKMRQGVADGSRLLLRYTPI